MALRLGCLVEPLAGQLAAYKYDPDKMDHFQKDMEAISRAHVRSLIPYSLAMKAYDKLAKRIVAHIDERNPLNRSDSATNKAVSA